MQAHLQKIFFLALISLSALHSCKTTTPQAQVSDFQVKEDQKQGQTQLALEQQQQQGLGQSQGQSQKQGQGQSQKQGKTQSSNLNNTKKIANTDDSNLRIYHPKEPTAWFTRRLLMTARQPSASRVHECRETAESAVKDAPNLRALDEVSLSLETAVSKDHTLYHWCFYQIMSDLDTKLEVEAPLMQDKAELFLERMKVLWALAKALDNTTEDTLYVSYLRTRYTDMSQNMFGRNLEVVDMSSFVLTTKGEGKAAGEFEE